MYLIRVFKNREQIARKVVAATPDTIDDLGRTFCRKHNGGAYSVSTVTR